MTITIYHNPRCSKSRKTLELIRKSGNEPRIVEYLREPPDADSLLELARLLDQPLQALLRRSENEYRDARDRPDLDDDAALARWLEAHPVVLQRPIVVSGDGSRAVIGRPPENVLALLQGG